MASMSSTKSSPKRTERVSSDSAVISFDLLSNLTYMSALATAETSRDVIFKHAIAQPYKTSVYFRQVYLLAKRLGFEYGRSFQLVSKRAGAHTVKSLLLRFAGSITSGESESEFLSQEANVEREQYTSHYGRGLETLQKWGDAYAALLVSVSLIMVVAMISSQLYDVGSGFIVILTATMFVMSLMGSYVIYKVAPIEQVTYKHDKGPADRRKAWISLLLLGPIGFLVLIFMIGSSNIGAGMLIFGVCLIPAGIFAYRDDAQVNTLDKELSNFVRSLGNVAEALGSTLTVAVNTIDRRSLGSMEPYIRRLQIRLNKRLSPQVCWRKFNDEIGSELVFRTMNMFVDGVSLGGSPGKVGAVASEYSMNVALLRAKRYVIALPFSFLTIPLHGAMTALLIFVLEIMSSFSNQIQLSSSELGAGSAALVPSLPVFQGWDMGQISVLTMAAVLVLTLSNTLAPKFATGGHNLKLAFYGSIMCTISGLNMLMIPPLASGVLNR